MVVLDFISILHKTLVIQMLLNTICPIFFFFKLNANRVKLGQEVMLACAFYLEMSVSLVACLGLVQYKASGKRVYLSAL